MDRRKALNALAALGAVPAAALAQLPARTWRVGWLVSRGRPDVIESDVLGAFPRAMRELGYVEGRNLVIDWRFADGVTERLTKLAVELVQSNVDVIVTNGTPATQAAMRATTSIAIVMGTAGDPVGSGLVRSLARPGGNVTGLSNLSIDTSVKLLELLLAVAPKLSKVGVLVNPSSPTTAAALRNLQGAASGIRIGIFSAEAQNPAEISSAVASLVRRDAEAIIVPLDGFFHQQMRQISELASSKRLLTIAQTREYARLGALISYGPDLADSYRRAASYVDRIFKGASAADLPVEQAMKLDMVINLNTAKSLGVSIPASLRLLADEVIG